MLLEIATHGLFNEGIGPNSVVVDLGANRGAFSRAMMARYGCTVLAVEPNAELSKTLAQIPGLKVVQAAVGGTNGWAEFHISENSEASTLCPTPQESYGRVEKVRCMTFETLLQEQGIDRVDVLKIDIEGAEVGFFDVIPDKYLQSIAQLTLELHDFNGTISSAEADKIEARLEGLGFFRIQLTRHSRKNVLFVNPRVSRISLFKCLWGKFLTRNLMGLKRVLARWGGSDPANQDEALRPA